MGGCKAALFVDGVEAPAAAAPPQSARCPLRLSLPRRLRAHGALHGGQLPHERLAPLHGLVQPQVGQRLALQAAALGGRLAVVEVSVGLVGGRRRLLLERAPVACSLSLVQLSVVTVERGKYMQLLNPQEFFIRELSIPPSIFELRNTSLASSR